MTVFVRVGLRREDDSNLGTLATVAIAFVVAVVFALGSHPHALARAWPYALAGLLAPGGSQLLFTAAVQTVGASRASMVVGTAPLLALTLAFGVLHEPVSAPLVAGALAIVAGGVALVAERRPEHLRGIGLLLALGCCVFFAVRDNLVRHIAVSSAVPPTVAAATSLLVGSLVALAFSRRLPPARTLRAFLPAGLCYGVSYVCVFEAYYRGRVSVVSPLISTETLWGVTLSALFLRHTELVGRRLLLGAALIVAGGVLVGVFR
jgi:drug/metabolite transporter (DMT)-like permease